MVTFYIQYVILLFTALSKRITNKCDFCHRKEDVTHFLLDCLDYQDFQVELNEKVITADYVPSIRTLLRNPLWYEDVWQYVLKTERSL